MYYLQCLHAPVSPLSVCFAESVSLILSTISVLLPLALLPRLLLSFAVSPSNFSSSAMQEDALKLVLLALEDGSALSRKVLVLFVVQKLEARFPQASKTSIGHVVQLLYRASCFKVQAACMSIQTQKNVHIREHVSKLHYEVL